MSPLIMTVYILPGSFPIPRHHQGLAAGLGLGQSLISWSVVSAALQNRTEVSGPHLIRLTSFHLLPLVRCSIIQGTMAAPVALAIQMPDTDLCHVITEQELSALLMFLLTVVSLGTCGPTSQKKPNNVCKLSPPSVELNTTPTPSSVGST